MGCGRECVGGEGTEAGRRSSDDTRGTEDVGGRKDSSEIRGLGTQMIRTK